MVEQLDKKHDLRAIDQFFFEEAKHLFYWSLYLKLASISLAVLAVIMPSISIAVAIMAAVIAVASEICLWCSDIRKGAAENLLRKLEMRDSMGWRISPMEVTDFLALVPAYRLADFEAASDIEQRYFASKKSLSHEKLIENIQESAWWSKHGARTSGNFFLLVACTIVAVSLLLLVISIQSISNLSILSNIARVVTIVIGVIPAVGLFRLAGSYYRFADKAASIESKAQYLRDHGSSNETAINLAHDYQVSRATSSLIPTYVWKRSNARLNAMWKKYRME